LAKVNKNKQSQNGAIKKPNSQDSHQLNRVKANKRRKMRNTNHIFATIGLIVLLFASYGIWQYFDGQKPPTIGGAAATDGSVSTDATPDFSISDINGTQASLAQYKGEIIAIHFMAVGCHGQINPINEYQLAQLNSACSNICGKQEANFLTVAVATCESSNLDSLRSSYGINWIFGNDYSDGALEIVNSYVPFQIGDGTVVLIDKNFNIAQIYNGGVSSDTLVSKINQLSGA
jgi:hypothetical protein